MGSLRLHTEYVCVGAGVPGRDPGCREGPSRGPAGGDTWVGPLGHHWARADSRAPPPQVDDILGEGSDDSDSEKKRPEEEEQQEQEGGAAPRGPAAPAAPRRPTLVSRPPSEKSMADGRGPR